MQYCEPIILAGTMIKVFGIEPRAGEGGVWVGDEGVKERVWVGDEGVKERVSPASYPTCWIH